MLLVIGCRITNQNQSKPASTYKDCVLIQCHGGMLPSSLVLCTIPQNRTQISAWQQSVLLRVLQTSLGSGVLNFFSCICSTTISFNAANTNSKYRKITATPLAAMNFSSGSLHSHVLLIAKRGLVPRSGNTHKSPSMVAFFPSLPQYTYPTKKRCEILPAMHCSPTTMTIQKHCAISNHYIIHYL